MSKTARTIRVFLLATAVAGGAAAQQAKPHPRLVKLETTRCVNCHGELIEGKATVHPPVADDCTTCHDMTLGEEGTTVALTDAEPALCVFCHDDKAAAADAALESPHAPVADSCLTCHDPHASDPARLLVEAMPELCSTCHDLEDLQERHGNQITEATSCASCHQPHGSGNPRMLLASHLHPPFAEGSCDGCHRRPFGERVRLRVRGEKLCEACHGDIGEIDGGAGSVHAALQGERARAGCLNCHDPHMSDQGRLLVRPHPELCGQCHGEIVAAAVAPSGHYPAADDCLSCHHPHASPNTRLLNEPLAELCAVCHDVEDPELAEAHLGRDPAKLACIQCHTPHGSGNFKLLATHLHAPVEEDSCDTCHEGAYNQLVEGGPPELCLFCHDDVGEAAAQAEVPHGALEVGSCTDCHNPHASPQERLVKSPGAGPCVDCHDEQAAGPEEVAHGVIEVVGCRACHEPHGGSREKLLRASSPELCLSCHDPRAVRHEEGAATAKLLDRFEVPAGLVRSMATLRLSADGQWGHPVAGHRVLGAPTAQEKKGIETTFAGELDCLTCHDPHKGRSRQILRWDAASSLEACLHCHPK